MYSRSTTSPHSFSRRHARGRRALAVELLEIRNLLSSASLYYLHGGERIDLKPSSQEYAVQLSGDAGTTLDSLNGVFGGLSGFAAGEKLTEDVWRVSNPAAATWSSQNVGTFASMNLPSGVDWIAPTYTVVSTGATVMVLDEAVVALNPGVSPEDVFVKGAIVSFRPLLGTPDQFVVTLPKGGDSTLEYANAMAGDPRVAWATPNFYRNMTRSFIPDDTLFPDQWHLDNTGSQVADAIAGADVNAIDAWNLSTGTGVTIAVVDDGIERTHPDLAANIFVNPGEIDGDGIDNDGNGYIDDVSGWSFVTNSPNPSVTVNDEHGTSVSGVAAGVGNNNLGVTGAAFNAKILPVQIFAGGSYVGDAGAASAIYYAAGRTADGLGTWNAAQVINCSWGGGSPSGVLTAAFTWASDMARAGMGVASFISSGNGYSSSVSYPANLSATLSGVMAVGATNQRDLRSEYSNYGSALDFVAPSSDIDAPYTVGITTTDRTGALGYNTGDYTNNTVANGFGGTSSASPLAAGVGALLFSLNPNLTATQVRQTLRDTADKVGGVAYDGNGFNIEYGYGRIDAFAALQSLGMQVIATTPANGTTVSAPPALMGGYSADFNFAYDQDAGDIDLTKVAVNGVSPASFTVIDADSLQFNFAIDPVSGQGLQTYTIDAGAVKRLTNGELSGAYSGTFRYDPLALAVTVTTPPVGSVITLPFTTLDLDFNEPVLGSSVQPGDFSANQGNVVNASLLDADTVRLTLGGLASEGTLTVSLAAGVLTDIFGNGNVAFSGSYVLDFGTVPYPVPLTSKAPLGSLVYDPSVAGIIGFVGDVDTFTIVLDAGQTISVVVTPSGSTLQPTVEVRDPGNASLGMATAAGAGQRALLNTLPVATAGTYTVIVSGAGGTTGGYSAPLTLNAALEDEYHGGAPNSSLGTAHDLEPSFVGLPGAPGTASRGAVVGGLDIYTFGTPFSANFETGLQGFTIDNTPPDGFHIPGQWHLSTGRAAQLGHSATTSLYYGNGEGPDGGGTYSVGSFNPTAGIVTSPSVALPATMASLALDFTYVLQTRVNPFDVDFAALEIDNGSGWTTLQRYDRVAESSSWRTSDPLDVSAYAGQTVQFRWSFDTRRGPVGRAPEGWYIDDVRVREIDFNMDDYYSFQMAAGQTATITLNMLGGGAADFALLNFDGTTLALASQGLATNVDSVISDFIAPSDGTYYIKVTGTLGSEYSVIVTRDAEFDLEQNNTLATAQNIVSAITAGSQAVLGFMEKAQAGLFVINWEDGRIFGIDPANGGLLADLPAPPTYIPTNPFGLNLASTGAELEYNAGSFFGSSVIAQLDSATGNFLGSFTGGGFGYTGLAVVGDEIFANDLDFGIIRVFNSAGSEVRTLPIGFFEGLAGDRDAGRLFGVAQTDGQLYEMDPQTGAVLRSAPQANVQGFQQGLGLVGDELFVSETTGPGGLNILNVYDKNTFAYLRTVDLSGVVGVSSMVAGVGGDGGYLGVASDYYRVVVGSSGTLTVETSLPATGPGEFVNDFYPKLTLLDASGNMVTSVDGNVDGRNSRIDASGLAAGAYYILVTPSDNTVEPTTGEYVLTVGGNEAAPTAFVVTATDPADGALLKTPPATITVDFNNTILLTTVDAGDLLVDGLAATSVTIVDGNTVIFTLPAGVDAEGAHIVSIPAGALNDVAGTPVSAFSSSYLIDMTGPRVVGTSVQVGQNNAPGNLSYVVTFSEAMNTGIIETGDYSLYGVHRGVFYGSTSFSWNGAGTELTIDYSSLPDDAYQLTLYSYSAGFLDEVGNLLDGEVPSTPPFPIPTNQSGDGIEGGDFVLNFTMDIASEAYPVPLTPVAPQGSLVYEGVTDDRVIAYVGDMDAYTINLDPGQKITLEVPQSFGLQATLELYSPANVLIGSATAAAPGEAVVLQTQPLTTGGVYTIKILGAGGSTGLYSVVASLNAALENESHGGASNDTPGTAQNINGVNGSFVNLDTTLAHASRGAILGTTDVSAGYTALEVAFGFTDISGSGTTIVTGDDSVAAVGIPFSFNFYGTNYTTLYASTNGLITFETPNGSYSNGSLVYSPFEPAIAVFWDDLYVFGTGAAVKSQVIGSPGSRQLIIQWDKVNFFANVLPDTMTFQAILSEGSNTIQLNYLDLTNDTDFRNEGTSATVGVKAAGSPTSQFLELALNSGPNSFVGTGKSTLIAPVQGTADFYNFDVAAGQRVSLAVTNLAAGNVDVQLIGTDGTTVLAGGVGGATNLNEAIHNFLIGTAGTYFARVSGDGNVPYSLVVIKDAVFDAEANNTLATAQNATGSQGALGAITAAAGSVINALDSGWLASDGTHTATNNNYFVGQVLFNGNPTATLRNYATFSLSAATPTIIGAELRLFNPGPPNAGYTSPDATETYTLYDVSATAAALDTNRVAVDATGIAIHADLGSGTIYGSRVVSAADNGTTIVITLNAAAVAALNAAIGSTISLGGAITTLAGTAQQSMFGFTTGALGTVQLVLQAAAEADWYKVTLGASETVVEVETRTPADGPGEFVNTLNPKIQFFNAGGIDITPSVTILPDGRNEKFRATGLTSGATYNVKVTAEGGTSGEYFVGVTPLRTPTITVKKDDGDWGFQVNGPGWTVQTGAGYQNDYRLHPVSASSSATNVARWVMTPSGPTAEVFASWVARPTNATNATYRIYDGATLKGTVVVDQTRSPNDVLLYGTTYAESLGTFAFATTQLRVELLTLGANGDLVADGVFDPPAGSALTFTSSIADTSRTGFLSGSDTRRPSFGSEISPTIRQGFPLPKTALSTQMSARDSLFASLAVPRWPLDREGWTVRSSGWIDELGRDDSDADEPGQDASNADFPGLRRRNSGFDTARNRFSTLITKATQLTILPDEWLKLLATLLEKVK